MHIEIQVARMGSVKMFPKNSRRLTASECVGVFTMLLFVIIMGIYCIDISLNIMALKNGDYFLYDFQLRYNEVRCLFSGINPLHIWDGSAMSLQFSPFYWGCPNTRWHQYVAAYPPWSYTFFMPFALLPKRVAAACWLVVEICCAVYLFGYSLLSERNYTMPVWKRVFPTIAAMPLLYAFVSCLSVSNYGLVIAASLLSMVHCLNRNRQFAAGFFLALAMLKPQIGLLIVVPLLVGRRFKTVIYGGCICLVASIPPALLCGESPIDMIWAIKDYSAAYSLGELPAGAFIPKWIFTSGNCSAANIIANAFVGVAVCGVLSYLLRASKDWLVRLVPAFILCVFWTVSRLTDCCVLIIPFFAFAKMAIEARRPLDIVSAILFPYCCLAICLGLGVQYVFSASLIFAVGGFATLAALLVFRNRAYARNVLCVTVPMSVVAVVARDKGLIVCALSYLLIAASQSMMDDAKKVLMFMPVPLLFLISNLMLVQQIAGWLIVVLLFVFAMTVRSGIQQGSVPNIANSQKI